MSSDLNLIQIFVSIINYDIMNTSFTYLDMVVGKNQRQCNLFGRNNG